MMNKVFDYMRDAADAAEPYVRNAGEYAANTVRYAGDCVAAALIALVIAASEYIKRNDI